MKRKRVVLLGATGSIGDSTLKVANDIPERMEIVGIAANSNVAKLATARSLPDSIASSAGCSPAVPTIAIRTMSASSSRAISRNPF